MSRMQINSENIDDKAEPVEVAEEELSEEELNSVSGGIIFVGGHTSVQQPSKSSITHTDWQTLNPQPIPPGKIQLP